VTPEKKFSTPHRFPGTLGVVPPGREKKTKKREAGIPYGYSCRKEK